MNIKRYLNLSILIRKLDSRRYLDIAIEAGDATINLGLHGQEEARELARTLEEAISELREFAPPEPEQKVNY